MNDFYSDNEFKNKLNNLTFTDESTDKLNRLQDESNNLLDSSGTDMEKIDNELILTKATQAKTSRVSRNGRTISRLMDLINKFNKTSEDSNNNAITKQVVTSEDQYNRNIFNLYINCYVMLLLQREKTENSKINEKIDQAIQLFAKFDKTESSYVEYLEYVKNQMNDNMEKLFDDYGIKKNNYMYANFLHEDLYGFSTFYKDDFFSYDDIFNNKLDKTKKNEELYGKLVVSKSSDNNQQSTIPKIIHIIYYKDQIDKQFIYHVINNFQTNKDFKIVIWFNNVPNDFNSINNIEFKNFNIYGDEKSNLSKNSHFKFLLKYYILRDYGGIYIDIKNSSLKNINNSLLESNFISFNVKNVENVKYIFPLGYFMGFSPNHNFVNDIINNFEQNIDVFQTEQTYIRSLLYKFRYSDINLLHQNPNMINSNKFYISNYTIEDIEKFNYFTFDDFDKVDNTISSNSNHATKTNHATKDTTKDSTKDTALAELEEIEKLANQCVTNSESNNQNDNFFNYLFFILITLTSYYFLR